MSNKVNEQDVNRICRCYAEALILLLDWGMIPPVRHLSTREKRSISPLPEKDLDTRIGKDRHRKPQILGTSLAILEFHIVVQDKMCHHRFQLVYSEEPTGAVIEYVSQRGSSQEYYHTHQACFPCPNTIYSDDVLTKWCLVPSPSPSRISEKRQGLKTVASS